MTHFGIILQQLCHHFPTLFRQGFFGGLLSDISELVCLFRRATGPNSSRFGSIFASKNTPGFLENPAGAVSKAVWQLVRLCGNKMTTYDINYNICII
jgi:hypothetical protein